MPIFETLLEMDSNLLDWIIHASPTTDEERVKMKEVYAARTNLDRAINTLVAHRLALAVANLPDETARLAAAALAMRAAEQKIETVESVLSAAGTAVSVAAKVLSFVTGTS